MHCDFPENPHPGTLIMLKCRNCGHVVSTKARAYLRMGCGGQKTIKPARGPCALIGDEVDRIDCNGCKGSVKLKVFACPLHGRCVMGKKVDGVQNCAACGDWQA